jgi:hypothetical protein
LWLLRHLDFLVDKMNQKFSVIKILKSVPWVLTSGTSRQERPLRPSVPNAIPLPYSSAGS